MTAEEALVWLLVNDTAVAAKIGTRAYPFLVPLDVPKPALAYQRISNLPGIAHDGATGLGRARIQITCSGNTYLEAKSLASVVRAKLHGYRGPANGLTVGACTIENEADDYAQVGRLPDVVMDAVIWTNES